jgi:hypothetical protein
MIQVFVRAGVVDSSSALERPWSFESVFKFHGEVDRSALPKLFGKTLWEYFRDVIKIVIAISGFQSEASAKDFNDWIESFKKLFRSKRKEKNEAPKSGSHAEDEGNLSKSYSRAS